MEKELNNKEIKEMKKWYRYEDTLVYMAFKEINKNGSVSGKS